MTKRSISFVIALVATSPAFAQVDAYSLRSKYGPPLDRDTFTVRPGIEMVVDYGPSKQVCKIQLPSGMQIVGTVPVGTVTKQQIHEVLNDVVPSSIRGKELNHLMEATGAPMLFITEYEHVSIEEFQIGGMGKGINVTFKDLACAKQTAP
jgi:hypothetical protein